MNTTEIPQEHLDWIDKHCIQYGSSRRELLEMFYHHLTSKADQKEQGGEKKWVKSDRYGYNAFTDIWDGKPVIVYVAQEEPAKFRTPNKSLSGDGQKGQSGKFCDNTTAALSTVNIPTHFSDESPLTNNPEQQEPKPVKEDLIQWAYEKSSNWNESIRPHILKGIILGLKKAKLL